MCSTVTLSCSRSGTTSTGRGGCVTASTHQAVGDAEGVVEPRVLALVAQGGLKLGGGQIVLLEVDVELAEGVARLDVARRAVDDHAIRGDRVLGFPHGHQDVGQLHERRRVPGL